MSLADRLDKARGTKTEYVAASASADRKKDEPVWSAPVSSGPIDQYAEYRKQLQEDLIQQVNRMNPSDGGQMDLEALIEESMERQEVSVPRRDHARIVSEVLAEVSGLGPLEPLIKDPSVTEIMVNGPKDVYVERKGKITLSDVTFEDDAHVLKIIDRIVSRIGRRCDEANPMVDARLADGSRVNAVIPPIALNGPTITIRRFNSAPLSIGDLVRNGSLTYPMASFLEAAVKGKANIVVSGGTGSGKTTLLNILSGFIGDDERIVTIEDAAELQLRQRHVVSMESRAANVEGAGAVTIRDLVRNSLRMRPDRIVVGECRGGEALDMLQAMNTGHEGSLTTAHANTPRDVLSRLETMVLMSGMELPLSAIRVQVSSAIDIIVQQSRFRDGSRKVTSISEVLGMEGDIITLQDIFVYKADGIGPNGKVKGQFMATGIRPKLLDKLHDAGIAVNDSWFNE